MVLFHGVGEDIGLAPAARLGVLLGADDDGLRAVAFVETVDHLVESAQLLDLLGIHIEEVLLDGAVGSNAHDNHPTPLVLSPLNEYPVQHLACRLHNGDGGAGGVMSLSSSYFQYCSRSSLKALLKSRLSRR